MPLTPSKWKHLVPAPRPERVLERYYPQLREWADVLTRGDRTLSEDIVHDLYVYVALTKPDFSRVENLDNYLYQSLRHMYLSTLSRASREATESFTVPEFDSVPVALWAKPNRDTVQQQNDLRRICCYAVWRKPLVRSASYFILRFFHGYRIQEIAEIACVPLDAIQRRLSEARAEVRAYLLEPNKTPLSFPNAPPTLVQGWSPVSSQSLVQELRASIVGSRTGECLSESELQSHYCSVVRKPVSTSNLSHIVSCEECLARIDGIGRRPTLKNREPLDGIDGFDGDESSRKEQSGANYGYHRLLRKVEKQRDDIYDHRPRTLSIAIDGKIVASYEVQSQRNVLSARTERVDDSTFVEVLSEQGLRLAILWFDKLPPEGSHQRKQRTGLSNDRWVDLTLTIDGRGLRAEVVYFAPELHPANASVRSQDEELSGPIFLQMQPAVAKETEENSHPLSGKNPGRSKQANAQSGPRLVWLWSWFYKYKPPMNPTLATALVLAVVSVLCFFVWFQPPRITANALLVHAETWDAPQKNATPGVIYQKVDIRTPRRTLERTIYRDAQGIRRPRRQHLTPQDEQLKNKLADAGVNWDAPLSAADFSAWRSHLGTTKDAVTRSAPHLLSLTTTPNGNNKVIKETLTVRDTDFHAVDRTIDLGDSGTVEIAELSYDVLPWGAVNQEWFEPASGLVSDTPAIHPAIAVRAPQPLSRLESDEIELAVRYALHGIGADLDEQINIKPGTPNPASISVTGVVSSTQRKQEILVAMKGVPHVVTQLTSEEEAARQRLPAAVMRAQPELVSMHSPIEHQLREYLGQPEAVETFSARVTAVTANLMAHAWALRHLSERYDASGSSSESSLSLSSRQLLETMRRDHLRAMSDGNRELAGLLRPVLDSVVKGPLPESTPALPLFANTEKVLRLTLALVCGSGSPDANQGSDPTNAAKELLVALRGLELNLKEQQ
jgi:RNA polymerase sigma factor (sigma-70 family)